MLSLSSSSFYLKMFLSNFLLSNNLIIKNCNNNIIIVLFCFKNDRATITASLFSVETTPIISNFR